MKKLITIILVLIMLLPAAALADDPDPIISAWYMYMDCSLYPEMAANFGNAEKEVSIYFFSESGTISMLDCTVVDSASTPTYTVCGRWSKDGNQYKYSIVGLGESTCTVEGDILKLGYSTGLFSMHLRRVIPFNPYSDYSF